VPVLEGAALKNPALHPNVRQNKMNTVELASWVLARVIEEKNGKPGR